MDPQDRGTRGQPAISMAGAPSPGGLSGFQESQNPVQTAQVAPKTRPRSLLDAPRRPKTAPRGVQDRPKTAREASKTPQDAPKTVQEASKTRFWEIFGTKMKPS